MVQQFHPGYMFSQMPQFIKKHFNVIFFVQPIVAVASWRQSGYSSMEYLVKCDKKIVDKIIDNGENKTAAQVDLKNIMIWCFCSGGGDCNPHKPLMENS